jgi:hypothetical protein
MEAAKCVFVGVFNAAKDAAVSAWALYRGWDYFWIASVTIAAIVFAAFVTPVYRRWHKGWLSYQIEVEVASMGRLNKQSRRANWRHLLSPRRIYGRCVHYFFSLIRFNLRYWKRDFWLALRNIYLPSIASVLVVLAVLALILFLPHPPQHFSILYHWSKWREELKAGFEGGLVEGFSHLFEGLIVVVIALIVFVAESVRSSKSADEKRVLLKLSNLWLLAVLVTIVPLSFLYPPATVLGATLVVAISALTVLGFARVLQNLLDPERSSAEQKIFLKNRVRSMVYDSVRQRVGNKLLFDFASASSGSGISAVIAPSWLPGRKAKYRIVDAPRSGILSDIHMDRLKKLAKYLASEDSSNEAVTEGTEVGEDVSSPGENSPKATQKPLEARTFLLRRFRSEISEDNVFADDKALLAIPNDLAERKGLLEHVVASIDRIFAFSDAEPPTTAFQREMGSTKDRLIKAMKNSLISEVRELRDIYILVAEEFLTILNELGGGYTAEQAKEERNSFLDTWSEVRWLTGDVRDLIVVAVATDNLDIVRQMVMMPYLISTRAYQANDQLLFQEFTRFSAFLYNQGADKPIGSPVGDYLKDEATQYLKELFDYFIQNDLGAEDDQDD